MALMRDILKMVLQKDVLEPGETVLLRVSLLPLWQPVLMTVSGLFLAQLAVLRLATGPEGFVLGIELVHDIALAALGVFMFATGIFIYVVHRVWTLLVTDRRLLQRQGRQYDEIPLAAIDEVRPCRLGDGLFVTGRGQKLVIPCKEKAAARIRAAIEQAEGTA